MGTSSENPEMIDRRLTTEKLQGTKTFVLPSKATSNQDIKTWINNKANSSYSCV